LNLDKFVDSIIIYKKIPPNRILKYLFVNFLKIIFYNKLNYWKRFIQKNELNIHKSCDATFDIFWNEYKSQNIKFVQHKSSDWLNWHINYLQDPFLLTVSNNDQIKGYAICCKRNNIRYDLKRVSIIDIVAIQDNKEIYSSLINGCIKESQKRGYHIIDMIGTNDTKKKMFSNFKTFKRNISNFLYYYYSNDPELLKVLDDDKIWDPTLLDGDSFLI
jgi:hypothetical protein